MAYDDTHQLQRGVSLKNDREVRLYMQERSKGVPQRVAAARAGMSERTARKYEKAKQPPSQLKRSHDWNTKAP